MNLSGPFFPLVLLRVRGLISGIISHLKVLKDDLNKIYGKTRFRATIKRPFQSKAILDRINQHKVYVKEARGKLVVWFHCYDMGKEYLKNSQDGCCTFWKQAG